MEMVGVERDIIEERINDFLNHSTEYMRGKGFDYQPPAVLTTRDRLGKATDRKLWLSWADPTHSLLFWLLWKGYHWSSAGGEQTIVLQLRCEQWEREAVRIGSGGSLGERHTILPSDFQAYAAAAEADRGYPLAALAAPSPPGLRWG